MTGQEALPQETLEAAIAELDHIVLTLLPEGGREKLKIGTTQSVSSIRLLYSVLDVYVALGAQQRPAAITAALKVFMAVGESRVGWLKEDGVPFRLHSKNTLHPLLR